MVNIRIRSLMVVVLMVFGHSITRSNVYGLFARTMICHQQNLLDKSKNQQDKLFQQTIGTWFVESMRIYTTKPLKKAVASSTRKRSASCKKINTQIQAGKTRIRTDFHSDSTYYFKVLENERVISFERGKWWFLVDVMRAKNLTHNERSTLEYERTVAITDTSRVVEFPLFSEGSGVIQQVVYRKSSK